MAEEEGAGTESGTGVEETELPSVPKAKREIEISKGVVLLPPEKISKKEERVERERPVPEPPKPLQPAREMIAPASANVVIVIALIVALAGLAIGALAMITSTQMKNELKAIAADLRAFKEAPISIRTTLLANHTVNTSLPVKDVVAPFSLPIPPQEIEGHGTISVMLPGYSFAVSIPWNGTIAISGSAQIDTSKLSSDKQMTLSYSLPGRGQLELDIKGSDIWTDQLEDITSRLEKISK